MDREGRTISKINSYLSEDHVSLQDGRDPISSICHQVASRLVPWDMMPYQGLSVHFCSWLVGHSAAMGSQIRLSEGQLSTWALWTSIAKLEKMDWHKMRYLSILLLKAFSVVDVLWWLCTWNIKILAFCEYFEISICQPLSQITSSPCFQCYSSQIPDHPAKSLFTTYKSMQICTSDHLFSNRVKNQIYHSKIFPLRNFPSLCSHRYL